ncbi:MAG: hypothetical protein ABMA26_02020 [Limisphaerales bacterium]
MNAIHVLKSGLACLGIFAALALSGCGFKEAKLDAEKVVSRHFQMVSTNGFEVSLVDYGPQFFTKVKKEDWLTTMGKLSAKLGDYRSHRVTGYRVFKNTSTSGSGTSVALVCETTYTKHPAQEKFTLFRASGETEFKIVGHFISSAGLLME